MADQESKIVQFIEITGLTTTEAEHLLQATNWVVEEAVELFFTVGYDGLRETFAPENHLSSADYDYHDDFNYCDDCDDCPGSPPPRRAFLPENYQHSIDHDDFHVSVHEYGYIDADVGAGPERHGESEPDEHHDEEPINPEGGHDQEEPVRDPSPPGGHDQEEPVRDPSPPVRQQAEDINIIYDSNFHEAKDHSKEKEKWLVANVLAANEPESYKFNRTVRENAEFKDIIQKHFIFWQTYDDYEEGQKISSWYKVNKKPAVLIIDPCTGYKMHHAEGNIDLERMKEILSPFTEKGPVDESTKPSEDRNNPEVVRTEYPALPAEPASCTPGVVNIVIRLPYGDRIQRRFLATDPIQVLWSFAATQVPEGKEFQLVCSTRGLKLNYDEKKTIQEAGVADTVLTLFFQK